MLGLSWILAGLGVYVRDIGPVMGMVSSLLMFLSPVFYSLEAVSEKVRGVMLWLPTTPVIENFRRLLLRACGRTGMLLFCMQVSLWWLFCWARPFWGLPARIC